MIRDLKRNHPNAFLLLDEIAAPAQRNDRMVFLKNGRTLFLEAGQALVPTDPKDIGFKTRGQMRWALYYLKKIGQIEYFADGKGKFKRTIATLISDDIFDINIDISKAIESVKSRIEKAEITTIEAAD